MSVDATLEKIRELEIEASRIREDLEAMVRRPMDFYVRFGDEKGAIRKLVWDVEAYSELYVEAMRVGADGIPSEELEIFRGIVRGWQGPILKLRDLVLLWTLPERTFRGMISEGTSRHLPGLLAIEAARTLFTPRQLQRPSPPPPSFNSSSEPS